MPNEELWCVDEKGVLIPDDMSRVPTICDTMEERRAKEVKERNATKNNYFIQGQSAMLTPVKPPC